MASNFYSIHKERPFFERLCNYMCSGPIIIELQRGNVSDFRKLIGPIKNQRCRRGR